MFYFVLPSIGSYFLSPENVRPSKFSAAKLSCLMTKLKILKRGSDNPVMSLGSKKWAGLILELQEIDSGIYTILPKVKWNFILKHEDLGGGGGKGGGNHQEGVGKSGRKVVGGR